MIRVFPAHAGMSPAQDYADRYGPRFPRPRGDEPGYKEASRNVGGFSPPTRG